MKIIDETIEIVNANIYFVKAYLKGLKFRNAKSGLYIYGRYTTYFISRLDLKDKNMFKNDFMNYMLDNIKLKEITEKGLYGGA